MKRKALLCNRSRQQVTGLASSLTTGGVLLCVQRPGLAHFMVGLVWDGDRHWPERMFQKKCPGLLIREGGSSNSKVAFLSTDTWCPLLAKGYH